MPGKHSLPAKLTRPAVTGLVRRERLFNLLDHGLKRRIVWVSGPGGAGKTSLVSTYLDDRRLRSIWYQLDAGDADLATFFHYLRLAARGRGVREPLPMFSPAHLTDLDVFSRRFFEAFFARLGNRVTLVFDDYQEVEPDAKLDEVMQALFGSLPDGAGIVVLSRGGPPPALARWQASLEFSAIDRDELRFSADESTALAANWGVAGYNEVTALHSLSRGWAAGMVLLLRATRGGVALTHASDSPELFNYFAAEIFARIAQPTQDFLLKTAFLPNMTPALAELLTGEKRAGRILAELSRDNFFTERKLPDASVYEYHPLFREFLIERAVDELGDQPVAEVKRRAASLLEGVGQVEAAAQLLIEARDWERVKALVQSHAEQRVGRGQFATLRGWIDAVPPDVVQRSPWLLLWRGVCEVAAREASYRKTFDTARLQFDDAHDALGACLARLWLARTSESPDEVLSLIDEVRGLVERSAALADPQVEVHLISQFRSPDPRLPAWHPLVARWIGRATELARTLPDPSQRLRMAAYAGSGLTMHGDHTRVRAVVESARHLLAAPQATVRDRLHFMVIQAYCDYHHGSLAAGTGTVAQIEDLADTSGFVLDQCSAWTIAMRVAAEQGDVRVARRLAENVYAVVRFSPPMYAPFLTSSVAVNFAARDVSRAASDVAELLRVVAPSSVRWPIVLGMHGELLLEQGKLAEARDRLEEMVTIGRERRASGAVHTGLLLLALAEERSGAHEAALRHLREGLALGRELDYAPRHPYVGGHLLGELFALALRHGIETGHVRDLIARLHLAPASPDVEDWPWPVRIQALGGFAVERVRGAEEDTSGRGKKRPKRPLEMLKYLVAHGGAASVGTVTDVLWPDAEGDAAQKSFEVALHRLRKLVGADEAIRLSGGKLSLNDAMVWVDSIAFERLAAQAETAGSPSEDLMRRAVTLYRGHLLAGEEEAAWAKPCRERLREKYLRLVELRGARLEAEGDRPEAEQLYRSAIALEPLAEAVYRRLIGSLASRGQTAEAVEVYRRCREMLSIVLGARPSPETEAAFEAASRAS